MLQKAVFPGKYIQGREAIGELPALVRLFGQRGLMLASPSACDRILPSTGLDLADAGITLERFRGECCETELARVAQCLRDAQADVLVGMGGGKTIDTAKIAADRAGIPVIIVPTIASTDAPCSGCAVMYTEDGVFETVFYQKTNPAVVLVDVSVIASAPTRFLVSGMGDALATWFEARSCERTQSVNECGGRGVMLGMHIARLCYDTLIAYGPAARIASEAGVITPALIRIIETNTLLSGIGFESAGLAAAHAVHNGLTVLPQTHAYYHGEKVAFGTLTGLHLTGAAPKEIDTVYSFCETVGLPTTLSDIGLEGADRLTLYSAAQKTCDQGQSICHEAGDITPLQVVDAMLMADAWGRNRRA